MLFQDNNINSSEINNHSSFDDKNSSLDDNHSTLNDKNLALDDLSKIDLKSIPFNVLQAILKEKNFEIEVPHCLHCNKIIDINTLNKDEKARFNKDGLCPECAEIVDQADEINIAMKVTSRKARNHDDDSNGSKARSLILKAIPKLTDELIQKFTEDKYSYDNFGLLYPLFLDITGKSFAEVNVLRKNKGHNRYTQVTYKVGDRTMLITNDIYVKNVIKIRQKFVELGLIDDEDAQAVSSEKDMRVTGIESYGKKKFKESEPDNMEYYQMDQIESQELNKISIPTTNVTRVKKKSREELLADIEANAAAAMEKKKSAWNKFKLRK